MPNSRAGWIPADARRAAARALPLDVDLSARRLVVRREGRVVRRVRVAIGRPGTRDADGPLRRHRHAARSATAAARYGCCALALTGRQPNVPQGWSGGDRIAIHGTTNEGVARQRRRATAACARRDARHALADARVTLGAQVRIRA